MDSDVICSDESPPKKEKKEKLSAKEQLPPNPKRAAPLAPVPVPTKVARVPPLRRVAKKYSPLENVRLEISLQGAVSM